MTSANSPTLDLSSLPDGVSATFTSACAWGCVVRTAAGVEQPHICVGLQTVGVLAPDLSWEEISEVVHGLEPLLRTLQANAWEDGVRSGRERTEEPLLRTGVLTADVKMTGFKVADAYVEVHTDQVPVVDAANGFRRLADQIRRALIGLKREQR